MYRLALIGHPVSHSLSPPMHNAALKHCGLAGSYELKDIAPENLERDIAAMRAEGFNGFNVTIPHKDAIYRMASGHTKESAQAQASNTVKILEDGSLLAHNTDIGGFQEALGELITNNSKNGIACILGTGGAAKAAMLAIGNAGFRDLAILSRDAARARSLGEAIKSFLPPDMQITPVGDAKDIDSKRLSVIINCSPMGQNQVPVPDWMSAWFSSLSKNVLLFDMVYSKSNDDTAMVALAKSHGLQAADGAEMLIRQAHKAFEFWTNTTPPVEIFRNAFHNAKLNKE